MKIVLVNDEIINIGDDIIKHGVLYLIGKTFAGYKIDLEVVRPHELTTIYNDKNEDKILSADLIIIAGMPFYWYFSYPHLLKGIKVPFLKKLVSHPYLMDYNEEIWTKRIIKYKKKAIMLGVGSCLPYYNTALDMINPVMKKFAEETSEQAILLTVRDNITSDYLIHYGIPHHKLPCPSIFAKKYFSAAGETKEYIVMNFMKYGGHYKYDYKIDSDKWLKAARDFYNYLIIDKKEKVIFSCHDTEEKKKCENYFRSSKMFYSNSAKDYINLYSKAKMGFVNRVHAAYPIYSFKSPVFAIGTDTRVKMNELVNMPYDFVNDISLEKLINSYNNFIGKEYDYSVIDKTEENYISLLTESIKKLGIA